RSYSAGRKVLDRTDGAHTSSVEPIAYPTVKELRSAWKVTGTNFSFKKPLPDVFGLYAAAFLLSSSRRAARAKIHELTANTRGSWSLLVTARRTPPGAWRQRPPSTAAWRTPRLAASTSSRSPAPERPGSNRRRRAPA